MKLLDQLRRAARARHLSPRTEDTYVGWVKRYVRFNGTAHPREMGAGEITSFLANLAIGERVSPSTQNQAKAPSFFYNGMSSRCQSMPSGSYPGPGPLGGYPSC